MGRGAHVKQRLHLRKGAVEALLKLMRKHGDASTFTKTKKYLTELWKQFEEIEERGSYAKRRVKRRAKERDREKARVAQTPTKEELAIWDKFDNWKEERAPFGD